ncbi:MAG: S-methyl-5-thioribose-1-phosphate isomerase [Limisphaerales bacterium]|jgi:methylthioribose-1-phosphate isomerase|nr:S-methyl-5-thioribose-1-phosphate isomerase [Verrucomicrobiota bacterium]
MKVTLEGKKKHFRTVSFEPESNRLILIDQRLLPHTFSLLETTDYRQSALAIQNMTTRGAGAIGATAAYGLAQGCRAFSSKSLTRFATHVQKVFQTLASARPTAVDPFNAMAQVLNAMEPGGTVAEKQELALRAAIQFAEEDVAHCRAIGKWGAELIEEGMTILTHCNAGWLAFVDIGSATAPLYEAQAQGKPFHVLCDETRPRSQGAILTAWELAQQGVPHHIIPDNAAGHYMQRGKIQMVITGADRVLARTGAAANKIGTFTKAVLAKYHRIPFYIAIPLSTIDWETADGFDIPIEERSEEEVLCAWGRPVNDETEKSGGDEKPVQVRVANPSSRALNPGFDVTPAELITGFITPVGILKPDELRSKLGKGAS